ncbi:hypothetical protein F4801DRAFT_572758 [Xylaria longipes]|nr:hypothetical protein F4801DRAFT_572758 [Xylaria longipes]
MSRRRPCLGILGLSLPNCPSVLQGFPDIQGKTPQTLAKTRTNNKAQTLGAAPYTATYTYTTWEDGEAAYVAAHARGIIVRGDAPLPGFLRMFRVLIPSSIR